MRQRHITTPEQRTYELEEPAPRTIPAGKILLSEYADVDDSNRARYHELERIQTPRRELVVCRVSAGFEPAGSVARWTNGYHAVHWYRPDGTKHGQRTKTANEALELAREWYARDVERTAELEQVAAAIRNA